MQRQTTSWPKKAGHSSPRPIKGKDRREERREFREARIIVLHPSLFSKTLEVA